jgi:hypothetical protein
MAKWAAFLDGETETGTTPRRSGRCGVPRRCRPLPPGCGERKGTGGVGAPGTKGKAPSTPLRRFEDMRDNPPASCILAAARARYDGWRATPPAFLGQKSVNTGQRAKGTPTGRPTASNALSRYHPLSLTADGAGWPTSSDF